jgi:Ni/Fe-hydrogenase 1 B-type cytochrome subunit
MSQPTVLHRVYVWELPVRLYHWVNALCVAALCVTGYLIGQPLHFGSSSEASFAYGFGWVRFVHFAAAWVFFFNFLGRIYWGFVGNQFARWDNFLPLTRGALMRQWKEAIAVWKIDIFQMRGHSIDSVGHNAIASWTYFMTFLAFLFQCATGFGLYAAMSNAWIPSLFRWVVPMMGGDFAARQWHHMAMWVFIVFAILHVYMVFYHDYVEGRGVLSSMAGGWKFVEKKPGGRD